MIKVSTLLFKPFNEANEFTCVMCETTGGKDSLFADIEFAKGAKFTIVVCSTKCEKDFKRQKGGDEYVTAQVRKMKSLHRRDAIKKM